MLSPGPDLAVKVEKGEPEAKITVPSVQVTACSNVHSAFVRGLERGKRTGRRPSPPASTDTFSARTTDSVKQPKVAVRPIKAVGLTYSMTASRVSNW